MTARRPAPRLSVASDPDDLTERAACDVAGYLRRSLARQETVSIALSGGGTPGPLYKRLAEAPYRFVIDWRRVRVFWVDERCVPPGDPDSNFRLVAEILLDRLPQLPEIYRMQGELPPRQAAGAYARDLAAAFGGGTPRFDLVLLGIGSDGHTASLFPHSPALRSRRPVLTTQSPLPPYPRLSLGLSVLNAARRTAFLVHGAGKAEILARVLAAAHAPTPDPALPAAWIRPQGPVTWYLDEAAAAKL